MQERGSSDSVKNRVEGKEIDLYSFLYFKQQWWGILREEQSGGWMRPEGEWMWRVLMIGVIESIIQLGGCQLYWGRQQLQNMHRYQMISLIGEGSYGIVEKCRNKQTKEIVAIKKFKESDEDELVKKTTSREIQLLKLCGSDNIINLKEAYRQKRIVCLVFEYVEYNLLEVLEKTPTGIDPARIQSFVYQMLKGLAYMHSLNIVHRDVKPENLLVNDKDHLKICDFGFAREFKNHQEELTDYVSTRWYRPPELLVGAKYGREIDMWAVGCIMAELIDGNPLFPGDNEIDQLYKIQKCLGQLTPEHFKTFNNNKRFVGIKFPKVNNLESLELKYFGKVSPKGLSFIKGLLKMAPSERLTAIDALKHPYFDSIREEEFIIKLTTERNLKSELRKSSVVSQVKHSNRLWKSNRQTQYGTPYLKNAKFLGTNNTLQKEFQRLALKGTQYSRNDWNSSEIRQVSQPHYRFTNKPISNSSQNPKRSSLETQKTSTSQLSNTQDRFGLSCSKLAINRIYGSKREPITLSQKVVEEEQQSA